jgi:WD40 repeat protein
LTTGRKRLEVAENSPHLQALSPDGNALALTVFDPKPSRTMLRIYDLNTGKWRNVCESDPNLQVRFSPDGKRILGRTINASNQSALVCFELATGKKAWEVVIDGYVFGISPDGRVVFATVKGSPSQLRALDADTGRPAAGFELPAKCELAGRPVSVPDGRTLLLPLKTGEVAVWDYRDGRELRRVRVSAPGGDYWELECAVSADGKTAVTNVDGLRRWDLSTGQQLFGPTAEPGHVGAVQALAFLPGGKELASVGTDSTLLRWDVATGKRLGKGLRAAGPELWSTRDGLRIANGEWSLLTLHDAFTGKPVGRVQFPDDGTPRGPDMMWRHALLGDGRTLLTYAPGKDKAVVSVTDYTASKSVSQSTVPPPRGTTQFQAFSPCGRWLAAYGELYQVASGTRLWTPAIDDKTSLSPLLAVTFSADGRLLCGRPRSAETLLDLDECAVWEVASGALVARLSAKHVSQVAFSPDNRILAYVTGWGLHLLDLTTGQQVAAYEAPGVNCNSVWMSEAHTLVFAPDGRTVATGYHDGSIQIWKVPPPAAAKLTEADLATAWGDLGNGDGKTARAAVDRLARDPEAATTFLAAKFRVPVAPAKTDLPQLIRDLDDADFATRERATQTLRAAGVQAEPALREALKTAPPEMKRRIEQLLDALAQSQRLPLGGEPLRGVRAMEVLERLEKPGARELLKAWAGQTANPGLAAEARLALERMK